MIRTEDRDGVRVLTLARAPMNTVDLTLVQALRGAVAAAAADAAWGAAW